MAASNDSSSSNSNMAVPAHFVCPITMEIMDYPLVSRHGHSFERAAIIAWIQQTGECPLTRQPLNLSDLIHHKVLMSEIRVWRQAHGMPGSYEWDKVHSDGSDIRHHMYGSNANLVAVDATVSSRSPTSVRSLSLWSSPQRRKLSLAGLKLWKVPKSPVAPSVNSQLVSI